MRFAYKATERTKPELLRGQTCLRLADWGFFSTHPPTSAATSPRRPTTAAYGSPTRREVGVGAGKRLHVNRRLPRTSARTSGSLPATQARIKQGSPAAGSSSREAAHARIAATASIPDHLCTQPARAAARSGAATPAARCCARRRRKEAASVLKRPPTPIWHGGVRGRFGAVCIGLRPARSLPGGCLRQAVQSRTG